MCAGLAFTPGLVFARPGSSGSDIIAATNVTATTDATGNKPLQTSCRLCYILDERLLHCKFENDDQKWLETSINLNDWVVNWNSNLGFQRAGHAFITCFEAGIIENFTLGALCEASNGVKRISTLDLSTGIDNNNGTLNVHV
ncbi:hypothetical protein NUW58_g7190 [Xylaria curta]|uniref:Uncharacterized protein n=1 Tax=Xylaria curta TaxID=42375 RepID=A0ACC1NJM6_9PEZI|nr:hypothetical protein NUW58_g7190 [Xylaria curta]